MSKSGHSLSSETQRTSVPGSVACASATAPPLRCRRSPRCRITTTQGANPALPMVYVIQNSATNQLVFLFRPSSTNYDYVLNFAFNQVLWGGAAARAQVSGTALQHAVSAGRLATLLCC